MNNMHHRRCSGKALRISQAGNNDTQYPGVKDFRSRCREAPVDHWSLDDNAGFSNAPGAKWSKRQIGIARQRRNGGQNESAGAHHINHEHEAENGNDYPDFNQKTATGWQWHKRRAQDLPIKSRAQATKARSCCTKVKGSQGTRKQKTEKAVNTTLTNHC